MTVSITKKSNLKKALLAKTSAVRKANLDKVTVKSAAAGPIPNDLAPDLQIEWHPIDTLREPKRRVRKVFPEHVARMTRLIRAHGFISPVTIRRGIVADGHT